jgi:pilus assembly protein Flp/PilA
MIHSSSGGSEFSQRRDAGATAVEYALIVFAIAAVIAVVVFVLGRMVLHQYSNSCATINTNGLTTTATDSCS